MSAYYGLADIGVAGMMTAGYHSGELLVQVGQYYTPAVADIGVAGMMVAGLYEGCSNLRQAQKGSIKLSEQADGVGQASFTLQTTLALQPQDGDLVVIAIGSLNDPLFAGYLDSPEESKGPGDKYLYDCTARNLVKDLQKRLVSASYSDQDAGDILVDLLTTYTPHFRCGAYIASGINIETIDFDYVPLLDACNELAARSGYTFYIDPQRNVHFERRVTDTASWHVTNTDFFFNLQVKPDSSQLINRVLMLYSVLETRAINFEGDGETEVFSLPRPPYSVQSMQVDSVDVTFGTRYAENNETNDFSYDANTGEIHTSAHATLTAGQTLSIGYTTTIPSLLIVNDVASQTERQTREGGDGLYDAYYDEQQMIFCQVDARAKAEAILSEYAWPLVMAFYSRKDDIFAFETNRLRVGQQQQVTARGRNHTLTVSRISISVQGYSVNTNLLRLQQDVEIGPLRKGLESIFQSIQASAAAVTPERVEEVNI